MKGSTYKPKAEKYLLSAACPFCEPKLFDASLKTTPKPVLCDYHSHNIATDKANDLRRASVIKCPSPLCPHEPK